MMFFTPFLFGRFIGIGIQKRVCFAHADETHDGASLPGLRVVGTLRRDDRANGLQFTSIHCSDRITPFVAVAGFEGRTNWAVSASEKQQGRRDGDQPLHGWKAGQVPVKKAGQRYMKEMNGSLIGAFN